MNLILNYNIIIKEQFQDSFLNEFVLFYLLEWAYLFIFLFLWDIRNFLENVWTEKQIGQSKLEIKRTVHNYSTKKEYNEMYPFQASYSYANILLQYNK